MVSIYKEIEDGMSKYFIQYDLDGVEGCETFYPHNWDRSVIINKMIRNQYSQDKVEAIVNNHFLNMAEWLDKKFKSKSSVAAFEDPDYDKFQAWRQKCKEIADEALAKYPID